MSFTRAFRQGFTDEQWSIVEKALKQEGMTFNAFATSVLSESLDQYKLRDKPKSIYKSIMLDEKTYNKIEKISKKNGVKKADIVRDLIMDYITTKS